MPDNCPIAIIDPFTEEVVTETEVPGKSPRPDGLCQDCKEQEAFPGWRICLDCSYKSLAGLASGPVAFLDGNGFSRHDGNFENVSLWGATVKLDHAVSVAGRRFRLCDLRGARFDNVDFTGCEFDHVKFPGARFSNCRFRKVSFRSCSLTHCQFEGCDFGRSRWDTVKLFRTLFRSGSKLTGSRIECCDVGDTLFDGCSLQDVRFVRVNRVWQLGLRDCDLRKCDLIRARFESGDGAPNALYIQGKSTKTRALRLSWIQLEKAMICADVDMQHARIIVAPVIWRPAAGGANPSRTEQFQVHLACAGWAHVLTIVLDGISVGSVGGIAFCILSGAFWEGEGLLKSLVSATAICAAIPTIVGLYARNRVERSRKFELMKR